MFASFKAHLHNITYELFAGSNCALLWQRDFCAILHRAYKKAFTVDNMQSVFRGPGLWPVNHTRLTSQPRPRDKSLFSELASVDELESAVQKMRENVRNAVHGDDAEIKPCGFLDTTNGGVMSVGMTLELVRQKMCVDEVEERQN